MGPRKRGVRLAVLVSIIGVAALTGCREEEQGRVMIFEPGTYLGAPDETLDPPQVDDLRSRALRQQY